MAILPSEDHEVLKSDSQYVDDLNLNSVIVGYGELGLQGELGYEGHDVVIDGKHFQHPLSAHGPSSITISLEDNYRWFESRVAFNDDVVGQDVSADFLVFDNERLIGIAKNVVPGDQDRRIVCEINGVKELKLQVNAKGWENCHSVWVDPTIHRSDDLRMKYLTDCLGRVEVLQNKQQKKSELCVATVGSPGFESWVDTLFASFVANAQLPDAAFVIFFVGDVSDEIQQIVEKYDACLISCKAKQRINQNVKSILYSVGRYIEASNYLCLDADMLVLEDLRPLVAAIDASPFGSVLLSREGNYAKNLKHAIQTFYWSDPSLFPELLNGCYNQEDLYELVVNDGFFAGSRASLCAVDQVIRSFKFGQVWVDENPDIKWRNQFIFNLAIAKLRSGQEVSGLFNHQLQWADALFYFENGLVRAKTPEGNARIVHFSGNGRGKYSEWRRRYEHIQLPSPVKKQSFYEYVDFRTILHRWVGHHGLPVLAWSFYGTSDGRSAKVKDYPEYGLYQTLFSVIRNNGCSRVLETGTARGISTSCIATSISKFDNPVVVTLDTTVFPERNEIWGMLPQQVQESIEARQVESIQGMNEAIQRDELYHAALLDSDHSGEHVYNEFCLAKQLVCKGGVILIHDPILENATVENALEKIRSEGYGVTRLLCASDGESMDDGLGLAVIENTQFPIK